MKYIGILAHSADGAALCFLEMPGLAAALAHRDAQRKAGSSMEVR